MNARAQEPIGARFARKHSPHPRSAVCCVVRVHMLWRATVAGGGAGRGVAAFKINLEIKFFFGFSKLENWKLEM